MSQTIYTHNQKLRQTIFFMSRRRKTIVFQICEQKCSNSLLKPLPQQATRKQINLKCYYSWQLPRSSFGGPLAAEAMSGLCTNSPEAIFLIFGLTGTDIAYFNRDLIQKVAPGFFQFLVSCRWPRLSQVLALCGQNEISFQKHQVFTYKTRCPY